MSSLHAGGVTYRSTTGEVITIDETVYAKAMTKMQELVQEGMISNWEFYLVSKHNKIIPVEENLVYLYDDLSNKVGAVGIVRNITERKKAEDNLRENNSFFRQYHRELAGLYTGQ